jgi:hypothetical protein
VRRRWSVGESERSEVNWSVGVVASAAFLRTGEGSAESKEFTERGGAFKDNLRRNPSPDHPSDGKDSQGVFALPAFSVSSLAGARKRNGGKDRSCLESISGKRNAPERNQTLSGKVVEPSLMASSQIFVTR